MTTADRDSLLRAQVEGLDGAWHALDSSPSYGQRLDIERRLLDLKRLAYLVPHDRGLPLETDGYQSDLDLIRAAHNFNPQTEAATR